MLLAVSMEAREVPLQCMYTGFEVITWSGRAAALWANYSNFKHINYGNLKSMSGSYDYLNTTTSYKTVRSHYPQ
jgi:hypothetical protein